MTFLRNPKYNTSTKNFNLKHIKLKPFKLEKKKQL